MPPVPANLPTAQPFTPESSAPKPLIGFVGQGFIGKNYADDFERRGYTTVRYGLEPEYRGNKEKIKDCDIVFIAVPTPTTPQGFSAHIVEEALTLVGIGKIAVIKSTILPGTTARLQRVFPGATLLYSPEFLSEKTAARDAAHPFSNIIGMPVDDERHRAAARRVLSVLPPAPFEHLASSTEAELVKCSHLGIDLLKSIHGSVPEAAPETPQDMPRNVLGAWRDRALVASGCVVIVLGIWDMVSSLLGAILK